ncbi:hypothetical protein CCACVL1_05915 [Corchorus capsularis]|uniref:Protein FAR1-RELATED SEQUENCE n=1 Tax=Corchorus capsularis TaxID=210143 RepID=A0A1R3JIJ0_COCAP|nr:hypothetical protein CCACVL1_05915 [Corchorus capsularis]
MELRDEVLPDVCNKVPVIERVDEDTDVLSLHIGMAFDSVEFAMLYAFYGKRYGFGIIQRDNKRLSGFVQRVHFACSREGCPRRNAVQMCFTRPSQEAQCLAGMGIHWDGSAYKVKSVIHEHSHNLAPKKGVGFQCNKGEFEENWTQMVVTYGYGENRWFTKLYKNREMWVPAFVRENF